MKQRVSLYPHTFLWQKGLQGLIYNTETGEHLHFETTNTLIKKFCEEIIDENNLYSVEYEQSDIDDEFRQFLSLIVKYKMGVLTPSNKRIMTYPPNPYVINNVSRILNGPIRKNPLEFLDCITIHLGGIGRTNSWYLQATHPFGTLKELSLRDITSLFYETNAVKGIEYKVVISKKEDDRILYLISISSEKKISFVFSPESLNGNKKYINKIKASGHQIILSLEPYDIEIYHKSHKELTSITKFIDTTQFLVNNTSILKKAEDLEAKCGLIQTDYIPIWDNNYDFFIENVLLNEQDLFSNIINKQAIHRHQLINLNFWGKLIILPNGDVYSDASKPKLGTTNDSLPLLITQELNTGTAWLRIRDCKPCDSCLYQWLCPSPSTFETLSKHTLCKIANSGMD